MSRRMILLACCASALSACGKSDKDADANAAAANYRPPTVTSRLDYGGVIERRFHRLDRNADDYLEADEIPQRFREQAIARWDANKDGKLSANEWGKMLLDRFDRDDVNKDGTVTSEERMLARSRERGR